MTDAFTIQALKDFPMVAAGDDLAAIIADSLGANNVTLEDGDILVLAQKIVSKAENRIVDLRTISPGVEARELACSVDKDPRMVELVLAESRSVVRKVPGVLITEHRNGWIMANAGIDASNIASDAGDDLVLLLPEDPDKSSADLRLRMRERYGFEIGVVISDSFGRPWRLGTTGVAIGAAGIPSLWDRRGATDRFGRELKVSQQAVADEIAAAASLLQGQGDEGRPVVLVRGFDFNANGAPPARPASDLIRQASEDLFR